LYITLIKEFYSYFVKVHPFLLYEV